MLDELADGTDAVVVTRVDAARGEAVGVVADHEQDPQADDAPDRHDPQGAGEVDAAEVGDRAHGVDARAVRQVRADRAPRLGQHVVGERTAGGGVAEDDEQQDREAHAERTECRRQAERERADGEDERHAHGGHLPERAGQRVEHVLRHQGADDAREHRVPGEQQQTHARPDGGVRAVADDGRHRRGKQVGADHPGEDEIERGGSAGVVGRSLDDVMRDEAALRVL